ncbi:uncharacterized protein PFL1_00200 [Pseudozyma flocculosa PF-1]|uniref:Related to antibiotic biosynthesis protein n=1 Tax=Pseudozyma flocculosa TaxID=84751 RepID=A0A5C3ERY0_9BASI|nr:uncharacterized protein PFL1_00200 [Pseudozyma flocculosa PF-1]EPQ32002.1 hypothetical protein PFL1_00200 [Pseudozyma flocculosa PF-1]SPO35074.1 related to antibiotic biosynthesis protein [Pseudozyma flocculosa]
MPQTYPFQQVDVFTSTPYLGNPVAVVNCLTSSDSASAPAPPTTEEMQRFAVWTNLSETTFLLPPTDASAHYQLRIFTTTQELPFAGHPTVGSCRVFLDQIGQQAASALLDKTGGKVVQQCQIGLVELRIAPTDGTISFVAPPLTRFEPVDADTVARACHTFGLDPSTDVLEAKWIVNGPQWFCLRLKDAQTVKSVTVRDKEKCGDLDVGLVGPYPGGRNEHGEEVAYEVRGFAFAEGVPEDPVTGSLNAGIAMWLHATGQAPSKSYVNSQGTAIGRRGRISIVTEEAQGGGDSGAGTAKIWVGGQVANCITGTVVI